MRGIFCGFFVLFFFAGVLSAANPTPAQIVADWSDMSGGVPGKVVYWRSGPNGICVMDLTTGTETVIRTQLDMGGGNIKNILQSTSWGPFPCWSPDGTRIYFFNQDNDWCHWVMNADGSNPKRIGQIDDGGYWLCSWYDNESVVYNDTSTANNEIVRIRIDASNDPIERIVLIADPPYGGSGRSYISAAGTYAAWTDGDANVPSGGGHRSVVRNFNGPLPPSQDEMEVIARDDDACDICINPDGSGSAVYCHATHFNATAKSYQDGINPSTEIFTWTAVQGEQFHWLRWSQHPDYVCYNDDRTLALGSQRAYIRKAPAGTQWMFLGNGIWGPDVWVGDGIPPEATVESVVINGDASDASGSVVVQIDGSDVPLTAGSFSSEQILSSLPDTFTITATDASSNVTTIQLSVDN